MADLRHKEDLEQSEAKKAHWKAVLLKHGVSEESVSDLSLAEMTEMIEEYNVFAERNGKEKINFADRQDSQNIDDFIH